MTSTRTIRFPRACAHIAAALLLAAATATAAGKDDQCVACHSALDDAQAKALQTGVHGPKGVSCADCHGGDRTAADMEVAMDPKRGFVAKPHGNAISRACAGCHDNEQKFRRLGGTASVGQFALLSASVHGMQTGGDMILQCTTCHGAHDIRHPKDPASPVSPLHIVTLCAGCHANPDFMKRYNPSLPTDQYAKYLTSVHGKRNAAGDPKPATCVSCHTAHGVRTAQDATSSIAAANLPATCGHCHSDAAYMRPYGIPTNQEREYRTSVHGNALLVKNDASAPSCNDCHGNHGATPPGVESIALVCGTCHVLNAELFRSSKHEAAFRARNLPECETCHGNHGIRPATVGMLGVDKGEVCARCHTTEQAPVGYRTARTMRLMFDSLIADIGTADKLLDEAEQKGMEVDDVRFSLRDARQARQQARTAVHAFDLAAFREKIGPGMRIARTAVHDAGNANEEYYFRREGLAVATLVITCVVILLALYIRRLERGQASAA